MTSKDMFLNVSKVNHTRAPKNNSYTPGSRPDWLLYVVPSIAFIVGLWLFSKIYRTQRRRENYINPDGETKPNLEHMDTESYENMAGLACPDINTQPVDEVETSCPAMPCPAPLLPCPQ
ncbi:hypothetical protein QTP86_031253 [Hemibagrus guttatus]|nr:hypothetical protein QTP86_031253 [Hemibagrus guttatus]